MSDMPRDVFIDRQDHTMQAYPHDGPHMERYVRADGVLEFLAQWMINRSIPTGHGDDMEGVLGELAAWADEVRAERDRLRDERDEVMALSIELEAKRRSVMVLAERAHKISDRYERYLVEMRDSDRITEWTRERIREALGDE